MRYDLGKRLRSIRERRGLTQREAARLASMSPQQLWDIESGRVCNPSLRTLARLARAYGVGVDELVGPGRTHKSSELPPGLKELVNDPQWCDRLTHSWIETLMSIRHEGHPLKSKEDFLEAFLLLRRLFGER